MIQPEDAHYKEIRALGRRLNQRLVRLLSRRNIEESGKRLGVFRHGTLALDTEDEITMVMDFGIHDLRHDGKNAVDRLLSSPESELSSEELAYLTSLSKAFYSLFLAQENKPGIGVRVLDLVTEKERFIFDIGFSETARKGAILATRIFTHEGITMTTGAALPAGMDRPSISHAVARAKEAGRLDESGIFRIPFKVTAEIIRELLNNGAAEVIRYQDIPPEPPLHE
ncbi:MAG TPA: hypothetical protein VIG33_18410 [Pseudobdellovibrionaceae bacterium]|jgi:hypothetical protein